MLGVALSELGERAYQVGRSAHPARESWAGATPTTERRAFLERLLRAFRSSGQVLIVHGKTTTKGDDWEACDRALTMSFLDRESLAEPDEWHIGKAAIRRWTSEGWTVLHTWALNGAALAYSGAREAYVHQLSELVRSGLHQ